MLTPEQWDKVGSQAVKIYEELEFFSLLKKNVEGSRVDNQDIKFNNVFQIRKRKVR